MLIRVFFFGGLKSLSSLRAVLLMKRGIAAKVCVNKNEFAHVMRESNFIEIFIFRFVFWEILNSELLYFIHLLEILTILDQKKKKLF